MNDFSCVYKLKKFRFQKNENQIIINDKFLIKSTNVIRHNHTFLMCNDNVINLYNEYGTQFVAGKRTLVLYDAAKDLLIATGKLHLEILDDRIIITPGTSIGFDRVFIKSKHDTGNLFSKKN